MTAKQREYKSFERPADPMPRVKHGDEDGREPMRRPATATPRHADDWR